jgi:GTP-binding protein Era
MKTGFVSIIGRPNAGKSTLINALIGRKISIVTSKPQTTRNAIQGVLNQPNLQVVFVDTPGIHKPKAQLGNAMNATAFSSLKDIDMILYVVDASVPFGTGDEYLINRIKNEDKIIVVFNKIDRTNVALIESLKVSYQHHLPQAACIEISALNKVFLTDLIELIQKKLKKGPLYFPEGVYTNYPESFMISELIREKIIELTRQEIPHSIAVHIDKIEDLKEGKYIQASVIVERQSQKAILIGEKGKMIRKIAYQATRDVQLLLKQSALIELYVKVEEDWRNSSSKLKEFGY